MRPCNSLEWPGNSGYDDQRGAVLEKLSKYSPVDLIDRSLRSISMSSTVVTERMASDLDLSSLEHQSIDGGLCYSSRSEDSVEGLFTGIYLFDGIVMEKLPKLKVLPSTLGLVRQASFEVPGAPHREGAEDRAFERTCETVEKSISFDLRKMISRFRLDSRSRTSSSCSGKTRPQQAESAPSQMCEDYPASSSSTSTIPEEGELDEGRIKEQKQNLELNKPNTLTIQSKDQVDFLFMVPS